jgi:hypothetical protein
MKFIILISLILFSTNRIAAQQSEKELNKHFKAVSKSREKMKALVSLDTFFYAGNPQAIRQVVAKGLFGVVLEYKLLSFENKEEMVDVIYTNIGTAQQAEWVHDVIIPSHQVKLRLKADIDPLEALGKNKVLTSEGISIEGLNKLLLVLGEPTLNTARPSQGSTTMPSANQMVERNRNGMIQVVGSVIKQGGIDIGTIQSVSESREGKIVKTLSIYFLNGALCATAKTEGVTSHDWQLVTAKDSKQQQIAASIGNDEVSIIRFLVDNLYL